MPSMVQGAGVVPAAIGEAGPPPRAARAGLDIGLDIGLVNNMPDAALTATERQFARLLAAASGGIEVRLHLFSLPGVPRGAPARDHMATRYGDLAALERARLDGLIVTGAEPRTPSLADEPYWDALTRVVDWAEHNTASTIWSCLAAHAAVLHLDGITRRRLPEKRFGLFECVTASAAGPFGGAPAGSKVPHSRWNDLAESDLRANGYRIASLSPEAGIDCFTKQWGSLFVFLQGHPEYDGDTLFREFRRDMRRFIDGESDEAPTLPANYFDRATEERLSRFRIEVMARGRDPEVWEAFPRRWQARPGALQAVRATALSRFAAWLAHIAEASPA